MLFFPRSPISQFDRLWKSFMGQSSITLSDSLSLPHLGIALAKLAEEQGRHILLNIILYQHIILSFSERQSRCNWASSYMLIPFPMPTHVCSTKVAGHVDDFSLSWSERIRIPLHKVLDGCCIEPRAMVS